MQFAPSVGLIKAGPILPCLLVQLIGEVETAVVSADGDLAVVGVTLEIAKGDFRFEAIREGRLVFLDDLHEFGKGEFLIDERGFCGLLSIVDVCAGHRPNTDGERVV